MSDFWDWAVTAYARPGVAALCLDLQNAHGENVPLLLWAAWVGRQGIMMDRALAGKGMALADRWAQAAVIPLRTLRNRLKSSISEGDEAVRLPLRETIKAAELAAERALMVLLAELVAKKINKNQYDGENILHALQHVSRSAVDADAQAQLIALAEALSEGENLGYTTRR